MHRRAGTRRCGVHSGPRISSAPLRAARHPGRVSVMLERASKDGPAPWLETLASRAVHHEDSAHPLRSDVPDGQISWCFASLPVQPRLQKYFRIRLTRIKSISIASRPTEGRSRVVTSAGRDAVDARASGAPWQSQGEMNLVSGQLARETNDVLADGKAVWFWHPLLVLNSRRLSRPDRAQTKP